MNNLIEDKKIIFFIELCNYFLLIPISLVLLKGQYLRRDTEDKIFS